MIKKIIVDNITLYLEHDSRVLSQYEYLKLKKLLKKMLAIHAVFLNRAPYLLRSKKIEVSALFCGPSRIQSINNDYRNKDSITDVLSFPTFENLRDDCEQLKALPIISLGDIVICVKRAKEQAKTHSIDFISEVAHLYVHGFLHLLGFDHEISKKEEVLMESLEQLLLKKLG